MWKVSFLNKAKKTIDFFILMMVSQILYSNEPPETVQIIFQQQLNKSPLIFKFPDGYKDFLTTVKKIIDNKPAYYSRNFICLKEVFA